MHAVNLILKTQVIFLIVNIFLEVWQIITSIHKDNTNIKDQCNVPFGSLGKWQWINVLLYLLIRLCINFSGNICVLYIFWKQKSNKKAYQYRNDSMTESKLIMFFDDEDIVSSSAHSSFFVKNDN